MQIAWNRINTLLLVLLLLVVAGALARGVFGGPLDPPAPPASTMKTLDQVEPRTPISQPASPAGFPISITQPGSYYLAGDITGVAGANGIEVSADDVTIDLNGFALNGVPASGLGIYSNGWNTTIENGGISGWAGVGAQMQGGNAHMSEPFAIRVTGTHIVIVRNTAAYTADNFDIAPGNTAGPEETYAATTPWSNVNY